MRYLVKCPLEDRFDPKVASVIFGENYSFSSMCVILEHGTNGEPHPSQCRCEINELAAVCEFGNGMGESCN
jgi:hypothetical protein